MGLEVKAMKRYFTLIRFQRPSDGMMSYLGDSFGEEVAPLQKCSQWTGLNFLDKQYINTITICKQWFNFGSIIVTWFSFIFLPRKKQCLSQNLNVPKLVFIAALVNNSQISDLTMFVLISTLIPSTIQVRMTCFRESKLFPLANLNTPTPDFTCRFS